MKLTEILEALGVLSGSDEVAETIYSKIISNLKNVGEETSLNELYPIKIRGEFKIGNYEFIDVNIYFDITEGDEWMFLGMTFEGAEIKARSEDDKIYSTRTGFDRVKIEIKIQTDYADQFNIGSLIRFMREDENEIVSAIAHEFHHTYKEYIKPNINKKHLINYKTNQMITSNIEVIQRYMYMRYFLDKEEMDVKISEFYALMKRDKITKSKFKEFLINSRMYIQLQWMEEYTYEKFKQILKWQNPFYYERTIVQAYEVLKKGIRHNSRDMSAFFNISMKDIKVDAKSFEEAENFIKKDLDSLNKKAEMLKKRLSKLYDLVPDDITEGCVPNFEAWKILHGSTKKGGKFFISLRNL